MDDDAHLLARTAGGDAEAFGRFFRRHERAVLAFAVRRCASSEDAADAVADTFLVALRRARSFRDEGFGARPWLLGIALRVLAGQRRGALRRSRLATLLRGRTPHFTPDESEAVEAAIDDARLAGELQAALSALPASERAVLELVAYDGLTPAEAAAVLQVSGDAARTRLSRARARMRASLEPDHAC
jgi:RNA polymerase sigma-70 factor (ECF subfamily)